MSDSIYSMLKKLAKEDSIPKKAFPSDSLKNQALSPTLKFYSGSICIFTIGLVFGFGGKWLDVPCFFNLGVIGLFAGYVGMLLSPFVALYFNKNEAIEALKNPTGLLISNAESTHQLDKTFFENAMTVSVSDLKLVRLEINEETDAFTNRVKYLVGAVDKFGLLPGIVALMISLPKIEKLGIDWVVIVACSLPFFHALAVYALHMSSKMTRYVALLDLVLESKESKN